MNLDVVVVSHNSASQLPDALKALPAGVDVMVVDNASSDDSAAIAETFGATVVRNTTNAGFGAGCNQGAALGHAKTILFLNPDAVIGEQALQTLLDAMDDDAQVGVAAPRLVHPDGSKQRVQWPYPSARGAWREALGLHDVVEEAPEGFVIGAVFAVRREAFEAADGFDERFWLYGEEADLCRRIEDLGWFVRRMPAAVATHVGGASGGGAKSANPLVFEHFQRGGEHFVAKHGGRGALVSYRAANLVGSLGRGGLGVGQRSGEHRLRARRLVRTLATTPTSVPLDSPASMAPGNGLVVCSLEAWDDIWRRNQFFVRELLATDPGLRVLFVEPAFDVTHEHRRRTGRRHLAGLRPLKSDGRIVRFEPVKWAPRRLGGFADESRDRQVIDAAAALGFARPRLWINDPSYATLADAVDWPAIYDITDDWTAAADATTAAAARRNEQRLFESCDAVTVCSPGLLESKGAVREALTLIPNGVDAEALQRPRPRPDDLPAGPCAVYVGTLHTDRLDVDLVADLAEQMPELSVVLVGPDALDRASRSGLDTAGVLRLGPRPYDEVPGYLQYADVLVVPHVVSAFTESLDPIKAYECLAVGTPTVATPVAGFRDLGAPVRIAESADFVDVVRSVLNEQPEVEPRPVPSWAERTKDFSQVLDDIVELGHDRRTPKAGRGAERTMRSRSVRSEPKRLVVNARFRQRPITGVERYATELTARLPEGVRELGPNPRLARPPFGHLWEQTRLPMKLRANEVLWSPCNTGPALLDRHIVTIHDISPTEHPEWFSPAYGKLLDQLARRFTRHALHVITDSEFTKSRLCDRLGANPDRVSIVPPGINPKFSNGGEALTAEQRARLGLDDRPYLLSVATFEPRKNLTALISAFEAAHRSFPDVTLVIAGNPGRSDIFAANDWNPSAGAQAVKQVGYVPEELLPGLYGSAEALVYVPHYEGFGLPPLEAAAAGTPSVLSDISVLHELGIPATWVDPNDVSSIAAGITDVLSTNGAHPVALVERANEYTWDSALDALLATFTKLDIHLADSPQLS